MSKKNIPVPTFSWLASKAIKLWETDKTEYALLFQEGTDNIIEGVRVSWQRCSRFDSGSAFYLYVKGHHCCMINHRIDAAGERYSRYRVDITPSKFSATAYSRCMPIRFVQPPKSRRHHEMTSRRSEIQYANADGRIAMNGMWRPGGPGCTGSPDSVTTAIHDRTGKFVDLSLIRTVDDCHPRLAMGWWEHSCSGHEEWLALADNARFAIARECSLAASRISKSIPGSRIAFLPSISNTYHEVMRPWQMNYTATEVTGSRGTLECDELEDTEKSPAEVVVYWKNSLDFTESPTWSFVRFIVPGRSRADRVGMAGIHCFSNGDYGLPSVRCIPASLRWTAGWRSPDMVVDAVLQQAMLDEMPLA